MEIIKDIHKKSLHEMIRTRLKLMKYIKTAAVAMKIDINRSRRMNRYRKRVINHPILPDNYASLSCDILDLIDIYIQVKKYSNEEVLPLENELALQISFVDYYLENKDFASHLLK